MGHELSVPPGWEHGERCIRREFSFGDFAEAFAFMTAVATVAEELDHHPDWSNSYNSVVIELSSHDTAAVTSRDIALAERINELL